MDGTGQHLNNIGRWPLLTASQEITLAKLHQRGLRVRREVGDRQPSKAERHAMRVGDRAGERMVLCNLRFAVSIAKKFAGISKLNELDDLIQYASIGLQKAVTKFDPERGYKFSTYARDWITNEVTRGMYNTDPLVYVPEKRRQQWINLRKKAATFAQKHGRLPSEVELLSGTDLTREWYGRIDTAMTRAVSLDIPTREDGCTIGELLPSEARELVDERRYEKLHECLQFLTAQEQDLIAKRYGINNEPILALEEIGAQYGVSRETIRNRVAAARSRLRHALNQS